MIIKESKTQSGNDISDFHDFLKVLEDLEENGDHVAIDSSVTKRNQKEVDTDKQESDKYYFDFTGDLNNLKRGFSSTSNSSTKKKKRQNLICQNVQTSKQNYFAEPSNITPYAKINTKGVQNIKQNSLSNKNKNKNIFINFSYRDNFESCYNSDKGLSTKFFREKDYLKGQGTQKQTSQNIVVKDQHNYCPSLCGSTDDEITYDITHNNCKISPNEAKSKKLKNKPEITKIANHNHKSKKKKKKVIEDTETALKSIDIIDSDCEIAVNTKINSENETGKKGKKGKKIKNADTSENYNGDDELSPLRSNQILPSENSGKKVNDVIGTYCEIPPFKRKRQDNTSILRSDLSYTETSIEKQKSSKLNKKPKQNEMNNIDKIVEHFGKVRRKDERGIHNNVFEIKNEIDLTIICKDKINNGVEISHKKLKKRKKTKKDKYIVSNESNQMYKSHLEASEYDYNDKKHTKIKDTCNNIEENVDIDYDIKFNDNSKIDSGLELSHKKSKKKKKTKNDNHSADNKESNKNYNVPLEDNLKTEKHNADYNCHEKLQKERILKKDRRNTLTDNFSLEHVDENKEHNIFKVDTNWDIDEDETNFNKSISNNIVDIDVVNEKVENKKKTQNNNHYNNENFKHQRNSDKHIFGMSYQLNWSDEVDSENVEDSDSKMPLLPQPQKKRLDKSCSDKIGRTKKNIQGKDSDKKKTQNIPTTNRTGDISGMYDLKFDNIEEINEDFNMGGISFEEDLSVVDKTICTNKNVQPDLKIRKRKLSETPGEVSGIELEIKHKKTRKITHKVGIENEKAKNISNSAKHINTTLPDLDETRLNVLINLKSKENSTSIKYSKSPRKIRNSDSMGKKVLIDVTYSDSHQHKRHWIIGVKNIEIPRDHNFSEEINRNNIPISDNSQSSNSNKLQHIKSENIPEQDVNDVELYKEIENPNNNDQELCSLHYDKENNLLASEDIEIENNDIVINEDYEKGNNIEDLLNISEEKMQVPDVPATSITNLPIDNLKTNANEEEEEDQMNIKSLNNVPEDQSTSINKDCNDGTENMRIYDEESQMIVKSFNAPISEIYNEDIAKTEIQYEEKIIIDAHELHFSGKEEPQEIDRTPTLELLKPLEVSTLSNFSNINITDADYTLQNIYVEELTPILNNSVSRQECIVPNCTDNFPIVKEIDNENETNISSMLNFIDIDNTLVYNPQKGVAEVDPDELIMDLDEFLNAENVEQLANSLSRKINDSHTSNITQLCEEDVDIEGNSICNDESLTNKEKKSSEPDNELEQTSPSNQHNSSESGDSISESDNDTDGSNYSDELNISRKKNKRFTKTKSSSPIRRYVTRRTLLEKIDQGNNIKDTKVNKRKCSRSSESSDSSDDLDEKQDLILKCNELIKKDLKVIITRRTGVEKIHSNSSIGDSKLNHAIDLKCSLSQELRSENSNSSDESSEKYDSKLIQSNKVKEANLKVILTRTSLEKNHSGSNIEGSKLNQTTDSANSCKKDQEQLTGNSDFSEEDGSKLLESNKMKEENMREFKSSGFNNDAKDNGIEDSEASLNENQSESNDCSDDHSEKHDLESLESDERDSSEESNGGEKPLTLFERDEIRNLRIELNFTQSPLHQLVTRASNPSKQLLETVRKANLEIKTGYFSKAEDDIIRKNWESFLMEYKLSLPPSAFFSFSSKMGYRQRVLFLKYLSRGLDKRWPYKVHNRFRYIYSTKKWKFGTFSKDEIEKMLDTRAKSSSHKPFKELEAILKRPAKRINERFLYTAKQDRKKNFRWDLDSIEQLVKQLMKIAKSQDIEELRHKKFSLAEWRQIAKHMNGLTPHQVKYGWLTCVHHRIFSDDVPLHIMKAELLKKLEDANVSEWKEINWEEIAKDFHGYNATYLNGAFVYLVQRFPKEKRMDLKGCLSELRKQFPHETPKRPDNRPPTKKLIYKDGRLRYRDEACDNSKVN